MSFTKWLHLVVPIQDNRGQTQDIPCPSCGCMKCIDFQYVGNFEARIGYLDIWCNSCNHGVHMSRVKVPDGFEMLPFGTDDETISRRIPNFIRVEPVSLVSD